MAQGTITVSHQFKEDLGDNIHDFIGSPNTIKMGFMTTAIASLAASDAAPHWGGTGTTNYATAEVTGGEISAGGIPLVSVTWAESSGTVTFDCDNITIAPNASNPTTAKTVAFYNSTDANKRVIAFMDLTTNGTTAVDLRNGATISFPTGILTY